MKGFKGFEPGLVCRGKQYAENTVFEEEQAAICQSGMHFCENPLDVLEYYPLVNHDGEMNEFAKVEALDKVYTDDNKKYCTTKLKIGAKLSLAGFVKAAVDFALKKCKCGQAEIDFNAQLASSGLNAQLASSGSYAKLVSSGAYAKLASSGGYALLASSGFDTQLASSGSYALLASSGADAKLASSGSDAQLASSGDYAQLASSGLNAQLASSGFDTQLASSGSCAKLASSGSYAKLVSSGGYAKLASSGEHSVVAGIGIDNIAKATLGNWIVLAEWAWSDYVGGYIPKCVKSALVDGETIKPDTWYQLKDGEFVEVQDDSN